MFDRRLHDDWEQSPRGTPRLLGRVIDGGAKPVDTERVFLVNPARIDGVEAEGQGASVVSDGVRAVPLVVIGSRAPAVGDALIAVAVGGRWVAESGSGGSGSAVACGPCDIPRQNLTLSWVNPILGNGSTTLFLTSGSEWTSGCVLGVQFKLKCTASNMNFGVSYFTAGSCPSGQREICDSQSTSANSLTTGLVSCDPLYLSFTVPPGGCPIVTTSGYTEFIITA